MTFRQYRRTDILILSVMACVFEGAVTLAGAKWFPEQPYSLSITLTIICLAFMRWDKFALFIPALCGVVFCAASGADLSQYIIYCVGNCAAALSLTFFKIWGKKLRDDVFRTLVYVCSSFVFIQAGRWAVSLIFGAEPAIILNFISTDALSLLFAIVVILLARNIDGLFEDQKAYLIRTEKQRDEERRANQ
ncbi:MAG: hypothetical protein KBS59_02035 [Clostridiales bacterium]|nr:hypothetical protein [Clostridiales bacterium]